MRYAYGVTSALLLAGSAAALITGHPAGAQVAQNEDSVMQRAVPRAGAPGSFADLTEQLQPAVVNISTRQRVRVNNNPFAGTPFGSMFGGRGQGGTTTREAQSLGSGFIISSDGYVVTNNHVVSVEGNAELEGITVTTPDGAEYEAELVGRDAASDLAVLKISRREPFPFVKFGDSTNARVGDWIIAIGNPFGLGGTVTSGIISAVYRNTGSGGAYDRYLQTDASINRGNSGGPMFDLQGNVIGINNAIFSPTGGNVGIGFAIPSEVAAPIVAKLREGEKIQRGYLGVAIQPLTEDIASSLGLPKNRGEFIQRVEPGEGADKAGIEPGDVVVAVDGKEVTPDQTLSFIVANIEPGTSVPIELIRNGKRMTVKASVGTRPSEEELAQQTFNPDDEDEFAQRSTPSPEGVLEQSLGLAVVEMTPRIARQLGVDASTGGVVVAGVNPSSDAAAKGLRRGDIILSANNIKITDKSEFESIVEDAGDEGRDAVLLRVQRRGGPSQYVAVRMSEQ